MTDPLALADQLLGGSTARLLYETDLRVLTGSRFQPTGFPDLGAALYPDPHTGEDRLLVESAQSMANRLEKVCWDDVEDDLVAPLRGLPYVRVKGDVSSASVLEAHRLNSPYVLADEDFKAAFEDAAELTSGQVDRPTYARALLHYDPNSLVHGSFMSMVKKGTARLERMLSAFIEAEGVQIAASGGVKFDRNDVSGKDAGGSAEGFGNVPFHRSEYVARRIFAAFSVDLAGLRGLRLPACGAQVVLLLALYKIARFLDAPQRLRTACDLERDAEATPKVRPESFELPSVEALQEALPKAIAKCAAEGCFADPAVTEVTYTAKKKSKK
ncbi:MAG TPA: type I-U CRISPR-associated RAMP protein Csb1/Cas7u [Polyangiaceae bacterium LLY-WYZ-15_(1-7)]|nr:type I-U CRISPR-associated protein Cas7 [Sandaracinus sp.]HJL03187.1 type I-U CRISPR-associated RAMP protein Csb1/Cas7u [Polyangiaceae bacterium LLY-WYZ-15_(1-7)]MBJ75059.1 type I-U CRISPR-associated protein Cas7 [Sandaracinus sp.]HJL11123.1 type I-U CRISPR-associated RAMP protein Csb1/Cas7u [Polyangiaceae bacterium LLY-WYZ-15_(1-7)]HJL25210.1 type I-U CRISPR-associated RAMP protein Csb1/Cas7u [Polyangiaceae bacterium LLY-WYZ-15_(1-7)]